MSPVKQEVADWRTEQRERAKALRHLLIDAGLNQTDVSDEMGLNRSRMSDYLNAHRQWPDDFERRFKDAVKARTAAS